MLDGQEAKQSNASGKSTAKSMPSLEDVTPQGSLNTLNASDKHGAQSVSDTIESIQLEIVKPTAVSGNKQQLHRGGRKWHRKPKANRKSEEVKN